MTEREMDVVRRLARFVGEHQFDAYDANEGGHRRFGCHGSGGSHESGCEVSRLISDARATFNDPEIDEPGRLDYPSLFPGPRSDD